MEKAKLQRRRMNFLLVGIVVVVLLNTWFAIGSVRKVSYAETWLSHTWEVIGQVEHVQNLSREADASVRGFIITGDDAFLKPFFDARQTVFSEIDHFADLTSDNANQKPNADAMRIAVRERMRLLQTSVDVRRANGFEAAQKLVIPAAMQQQNLRVKVIADRMEGEERRLLTIRQADTRHTTFLAYFAVALASGLDLLLLVLVAQYLARERLVRLAAEEAKAQLEIAHQEVARNADEVRLLNEELEERVRIRTADLESTNRELEAFSYSVSHDLRAPLRTIDGFSLALEEDYAEAVDDTGRDYIKRVRSGVQRMGGLIDALLQLSRITRAELNRENVDVSALVAGVAENLKVENPQQTIEFDIQAGMTAFADPHLLRVAFENLLGNAVKFSSKKPVSQIAVTEDPAGKTIQVADNGAGFDMQYAAKLFSAFNRLHGDKDFKGSGIGLATVARVVGRHHGSIHAEAVVGDGARFWFTLG